VTRALVIVSRTAALAAVMACGHAAKPPPDMPDELPRHDDAPKPATATATTPSAPEPSPPVPALAGDGPHAFVGDAGGLVEIAPSGKTQAITTVQPSWCAADARGQVVWFVEDDRLKAFDLVDRRVRMIVATGGDDVTIDWGSQRLGAESKVHFQIALALRMTTPPQVSPELGCDGDMAVYCYADEQMSQLTDELKAREHAIAQATILDPAYVTSVVTRGASGSLWTPPPVPPIAPAKKPRVDRRACDADPSDCGHLTAIPGSPLWLVTTGNSRGDFYHETRELWDPATGEYVALANGAVTRAKQPGSGERDYGDLRIAPSGMMSIDGIVFDPARVVYAPRGDTAMTCGWSSGGWRIPGVAE